MTRRMETRDWTGRRATGRRRAADGWLWATASILVLAGSAVGVIWEQVMFNSALLRYEGASREQERLLSDVNAQYLKLQRTAVRSTLLPRAAELGLIDSKVEDMLLVDLGPDQPARGPGLLDGLVPEAMASETGPRSRTARGVAGGSRIR